MKTRLITTALLTALSITTIGAAVAQAPAAGTQATGPDGERQRAPGPRAPGGDRIDALARLDTDNDGRISRAEAQAGRPPGNARRTERPAVGEGPRADGPRREGARGADARGARPLPAPGGKRPHTGGGVDPVADFNAIDANRDGYLTRSELRTWHTAKSAERRAEGERRFDARFREADLNNDGQLSRVEVSEQMPALAERFAWLDENRDGVLSREELRPLRLPR